MDINVYINSAEKVFAERGFSLEEALYYYFGRNYSAGNFKEKQSFKFFLVNVVSNNVANDVREKFKKAANIINNMQRSSTLAKLGRKYMFSLSH